MRDSKSRKFQDKTSTNTGADEVDTRTTSAQMSGKRGPFHGKRKFARAMSLSEFAAFFVFQWLCLKF
jgi:hypothetical protein